MVGAARARVARERARMGLISIIVFTVSQSAEERITLLGGGGEVPLLYTPDILCTWQCSTQSHSKEHQTIHAGAKQFDSFDEIFGPVSRQI